VAVDVALILGHTSTKDATRILEEDEKGAHAVDTLGESQQIIRTNESGLYSLVLRFRIPEAERRGDFSSLDVRFC